MTKPRVAWEFNDRFVGTQNLRDVWKFTYVHNGDINEHHQENRMEVRVRVLKIGWRRRWAKLLVNGRESKMRVEDILEIPFRSEFKDEYRQIVMTKPFKLKILRID